MAEDKGAATTPAGGGDMATVLVGTANAEQVRNDLRGAVVVAVDPDDFHFIRELP